MAGGGRVLADKAMTLTKSEKNAWRNSLQTDEAPQELKDEYSSFATGGYGQSLMLNLTLIIYLHCFGWWGM